MIFQNSVVFSQYEQHYVKKFIYILIKRTFDTDILFHTVNGTMRC